MFYAQLLHTQVARAAFLCLRFRFVLYWCKPTGAKAARRTLMKLSPGLAVQELANEKLFFLSLFGAKTFNCSPSSQVSERKLEKTDENDNDVTPMTN
jgi:hypothetical protein